MDYQKLSKITDSVNKKGSRNYSIGDSAEPGSPEAEKERFSNFWTGGNRQKGSKKGVHYVTLENPYGQFVYKFKWSPSEGEWQYEYEPGSWASVSELTRDMLWWDEISKEDFEEFKNMFEEEKSGEEIDAENRRYSW